MLTAIITNVITSMSPLNKKYLKELTQKGVITFLRTTVRNEGPEKLSYYSLPHCPDILLSVFANGRAVSWHLTTTNFVKLGDLPNPTSKYSSVSWRPDCCGLFKHGFDSPVEWLMYVTKFEDITVGAQP